MVDAPERKPRQVDVAILALSLCLCVLICICVMVFLFRQRFSPVIATAQISEENTSKFVAPALIPADLELRSDPNWRTIESRIDAVVSPRGTALTNGSRIDSPLLARLFPGWSFYSLEYENFDDQPELHRRLSLAGWQESLAVAPDGKTVLPLGGVGDPVGA